MLSHISTLGTLYPATAVPPAPKDGCLLVFPNYVTGFLMGVECAHASRRQVEELLKRAHAERFYAVPPPQVLSERVAANLLNISQSTLRVWASKGWVFRWCVRQGGPVYSNAEIQALRLARPRSL